MIGMKKFRQSISLILAAMMIFAYPGMAFAEGQGDTDAPGNEGVPAAGSVDLSDMTEENAAADELLVLAAKGTSKRELSGIADVAGASLDNVGTLNDGTKLAKVSFDDPGDAQQIADELIADDKVLIVQPNYKYKLCTEEEQSEEGSEAGAGEAAAADTYSGETEKNKETVPAEASLSADGIKTGSVVSIKEGVGKNYTDRQWYLGEESEGSTKAADAWKLLEKGDMDDAVTVAVLDSGVKTDHSDLTGNIILDKCTTFNYGKQYRFGSLTEPSVLEADPDGTDDNFGHGTHVCGLIAASTGDNFGIDGISDNRAKLVVIDVVSSDASPYDYDILTEDMILAIDYAAGSEVNADVINISIGGNYRDYLLEHSLKNADDRGVLCVCAAGNEATDLRESPGDAPAVISVMAHNSNGDMAVFSNYGTEKDVSAPGDSIFSTYNVRAEDYDYYCYLQGTSMAAPLVSGLAALIKSEDNNLNARELKNYIYTSSGTGTYDSFGFGKINAVNAINNVHGNAVPEDIVLNRSGASLCPGETTNLEYAVYPGKASRYADEVTFASSDPSVARVDEDGCITAVSAGDAVITASCRGVKKSCSVNVSGLSYKPVYSLPYPAQGEFTSSDHMLTLERDNGSGGTELYEVIVDGYKVSLKGGTPASISVTCYNALPSVRIYDPSGREISINQSPSGSGSKLNGSFTPERDGVYYIQVMGELDGVVSSNSVVYSLSISGTTTPYSINETQISDVSDMTYTGNAIVQNITVTHEGNVLTAGKDYSVSYSDNVHVGTAAVTITGMGSFAGSVSKSFRILPKGAKIKRPRRSRRSVTVRWKRQTAKMPSSRVTGYQVQVSADPTFSSGVKTSSVRGYKKTSRRISKLKRKTRYYVKVRTYMVRGGKRYYSGWSAVRSVKTR